MSSASGGDVPAGREKDSKYRAYAKAIDQALKTFETPNEWADLISALGKLAKVFQSNAKFGAIPNRVTVAKRLSQCLHPALPAGVHLKALETYRIIFEILGPSKLPECLYLFAVGLFPLMDHCGIKVKSELFAIFENYLVPLGANLRPALPGFLGGVLLALEEGTEFHERSVILLDRVCEKVGPRAFYACLWQAILGSPPVRLPAMIYVNAKFDKLKSFDDQIHLVGDHVNHMVAALCAVADDTGSPLVQRYLLDFLVSAFPLDSTNLTDEDFVQLLRRCLFVVLRRDMSLNRRLYTWLINRSGETRGVSGLSLGGPDDGIELSFFKERVLGLVHGALEQYLSLDMIETPFANHQQSIWGDRKEAEQVQFAEVRVCRLLLYLQDRADIGRTILETVFSDFLKKSAEFHQNSAEKLKNRRKSKEKVKNLRKPGDREGLYLDLNSVCSTSNREDDVTSTTSSGIQNSTNSNSGAVVIPDEEDVIQTRRVDELSKTFNMLLNSLEPGFLWTFLGEWYQKIVENKEFGRQIHDFSQVVSICLEISNVDSDSAIRTQHLPRLLETVLNGLSNKTLLSSCDQNDLLQLYTVCQKLLEISTAHPQSPIEVDEIAEDSLSLSQEVTAIEHERSQTDACLTQCVSALSSIFEIYTTRRDPQLIPLIDASTALLNAFLEVPIYYLGFDIVDNPDDVSSHSEVQPWLKNMLKVIDGPGWLREMRSGNEICSDVSARASLLELLCKIYVKSVSVLQQHEEAAHRPHDDFYDEMTHVLLKPLLGKRDVQFIEQGKVFGTCGEAVWLGIASRKFCCEQQRLARLLVELHSRRPQEASSDVESIVVQALTSTDDMICTEAARTFHRVWVLTRNLEEGGGAYRKPFNRAVMILLGVLADESVSKTRTELKAAASAWFQDCSKHHDLPKIVQMLSTMLMNPVTARISIQYIRQETKMTQEECAAIPANVSAVTLMTIDGKQRLYHVTNQPALSTNSTSLDSASSESTWITEVRNRLLRASAGEESGDSGAAGGGGASGIIRPPSPENTDVLPAFDDDTDSLDTLSMGNESPEDVVKDILAILVDEVCQEYEDEDLERERLRAVLMMNDVEPAGASFSLPNDDSESSEKPAPICPDSIVQRVKKGHRRQDSLQESIFNMTEKDLCAFDTSEIFRPSTESTRGGTNGTSSKETRDTILPGTVSSASSTSSTTGTSSLFEEMHTHMLLYGESGKVVDLARAETAFRILTALLAPRGATGNRMLLNCLVSSGTTSGATTSSESTAEHSLVELMQRHVRAILGQHFWSAPASDEEKHKHITLLELLITISLHFLRSYFLNSPISPVTESDLASLWKCKISALEFLCELFRELSAMLNEHESKQFVQFVQTILNRSKLQKCLLHLLLTAVDHNPENSGIRGTGPLSVSISKFNEGLLGESRRLSPLLAAYHRSLLTFTSHAIRLECDIKRGFTSFSDASSTHRYSIIQSVINQSFNSRTSSRLDNHASTVELRAFLLILLNALKKQPHRHEMWLQFVVQILPWVERSLATIVCRVVEQLCKNMENAMSVAYENPPTSDVVVDSPGEIRDEPDSYPANYLAMTLESLTTLVHFCVIDSVPMATTSTAPGAPGSTTTSSGAPGAPVGEGQTPTSSTSMVGHAMSVIPGSKVATELFSQLGKVFSMSGDSGGVISKMDSGRQHGNGWRQAQSDMLTSLPHSLATVCNVWTVVRRGQSPLVPIGTNSQLRRLVLQLLSPIAQHHKHAFLTSLALVWLTRSTAKPTVTLRKQDPDRATFDYSSAQLDITNLLLSLQVIPFEDLITSVNSTLREASFKANKVGITTIDKANFPTEEPLLELVHSCVSAVLQTQLRLCWSSLLSLFSDAPLSALSARAVFLLFVILSDFVKCVGGAYIVEDKAMYRNVQEVCSRLAEAVNAIVGWQLETTTWLKRTLVVKQDHHGSSIRSVDQSPVVESATNLASGIDSTRNSTLSLIKPTGSSTASSITTNEGKPDKKSSSNLRASIKDTNNNRRDPAHSTQALFLLAERLTDLLDSVSKSDEKDKVLPTLQAVWANVVPYLKAKNARNARFFLASSQLLASMSSYSYMRPVWKKTTLDLLLDSGFFKMDHAALRQWLVVTDHLMTHDRTSFKDLLKSISYSPNASFSIMTSKEQEYEARAQALKRLTFVVFGSQLDQYHGQMNDIQERLSDNLRVSQSPVIRSAVFLCVRVLLLRLRPHSLIGVWPIMVTELVHALSQLESQLQSGEQEATGSSSDQWMQLYVAACKLLETLCTLPAGYLSHFQMFHWAFVSSVSADKTEIFKPFAERINDLLAKKYGELTPETMSNHTASLAGVKILTSFEELRPFFYTLANLNKSVPESNNTLRDAHALSGSLTYKNAVARLESALYVDFSEHLQF